MFLHDPENHFESREFSLFYENLLKRVDPRLGATFAFFSQKSAAPTGSGIIRRGAGGPPEYPLEPLSEAL